MAPALVAGTAAISANWHSWLDHPAVAEHYRQRGLVDGLPWEAWVTRQLGRPPERSLQLGCGTGARSLFLYENHLSRAIDGIDISEGQIADAENGREMCGAPGLFRVGDLNSVVLPAGTYDLIFASHQMHRIVALEHLLDHVHASLTQNGMCVIEGYVGPSRFQWTDTQMAIVKTMMAWVPESLRRLRWDALKTHEGRPERTAVADGSPFEAIRSAEIVSLFQRRFRTVATRSLGGTLQHLFYNGIVHNFAPHDREAERTVAMVSSLEDVLLDTHVLPSDFMIMIGARR